MRAVVTRVTEASVHVDGDCVGRVGPGLLVLVGIGPSDDVAVAERLADRVVGLRIFADERGRFARSLTDVGGGVLAVPQFTLFADTSAGRRPSFTGAAAPSVAAPLFARFVDALARRAPTQCGRFGAHMAVASNNDGPVTIWLEEA